MIAIHLFNRSGPPSEPLASASFGPEGGCIGRDPACTLVLPDSDRGISRRHLQVSCRNGRYAVRLVSASMLVTLDGQPLVPGLERPLDVGSRLIVGPYVLEVRPAEGELQSFKLPQANGRASLFGELLPATGPVELDLVVGDPTGARPRPPAGGPDELLAALFAGMALPMPKLDAGERLALAERIGVLLRTFVRGALSLVEARSVAKQDLGLGTGHSTRGPVNPLKLAGDARGALSALLAPGAAGHLETAASVHALFDEWCTHDEAMRDGLRAALAAALDGLDPQTLELRLSEAGLLDQVLPAARKARLWERYVDRHRELVHEVEQAFDAALAGAFIRAFEQRMAQPRSDPQR